MKRTVVGSVLCVLATLLCAAGPLAASASAFIADADEATNREHRFRFAAGTRPADRTAFLDSVTHAGAGARKIIHLVDDSTTVSFGRTHRPDALGQASGYASGRFKVRLLPEVIRSPNVALRMQVVLHELGHVVGHALVGERVVRRMGAQIPCQRPRQCSTNERFADGFALWAHASGDRRIGPTEPSRPFLIRWGRTLRAHVGV